MTIYCFTEGYVPDYVLAVSSIFLWSPLVVWQLLRGLYAKLRLLTVASYLHFI